MLHAECTCDCHPSPKQGELFRIKGFSALSHVHSEHIALHTMFFSPTPLPLICPDVLLSYPPPSHLSPPCSSLLPPLPLTCPHHSANLRQAQCHVARSACADRQLDA